MVQAVVTTSCNENWDLQRWPIFSMLASIDDDRTINLEQHTVFDHQHLCQLNVDVVGLVVVVLDTRVPDR